MDGLIIVLAIVLAWSAAMAALFKYKKDELKQRGITFWGPFVMMRTQRGKIFLERVARRARFWRWFGNLSIGIVVFFMIAMFMLLVWQATLVSQIPADQAPSPQMLIGIPGVNPIIPVWYGIWGLVVGVLVHELSHGILSIVGKMKVKSMGILFFIIPMGAFVEPDEEQMKTAPRKPRMRVYAVGPGVNIMFALICGALFCWVFMGAIVPVSNGAPVTYVVDWQPAWDAGMMKGDFIVEIDGTTIIGSSGFRTFMNDSTAGDHVTITLARKGQENRNVTVRLGYWKSYDDLQVEAGSSWYPHDNASLGIFVEEDGGVVISDVLDNSPGYHAGMREGDVLVSLNGTYLVTAADYEHALSLLMPGEEASFVSSRNGTLLNSSSITPGVGKGYFGIYPGPNLYSLAASLHRPGDGIENPGDLFVKSITFIGLPFRTLGDEKVTPMEGLITEMYEVQGPLAFLGDGFWIVSNLLYWAFWISLMVGLTNALPAVPMDGGYVLHDLLSGAMGRFIKDEKKVEKAVGNVTMGLALAVLFLIVWQLIGPRIM
ncbi:MAG: site-2 protease family protein [Candidatus Thermoplasmatota archaeon]|nr:site-2 protease family protein [Candidatus Thermoplasmatota archaeon]